MVEDTELVSTVKDADGEDLEESQVKTLVQVPRGENVRLPGSDARAGDLVLRNNDVITSLGGEIGTLVFVGRREVSSGRTLSVRLSHSTMRHHGMRIGKGPTQTCRSPFEHGKRNFGCAITKSAS